MTDENLKLLDEEIKNQILNLATLTPGSKEHTDAVETLVKLQKIDNENYKNQLDADDKYYRREMDKDIRCKELKLKDKELKLREQELLNRDENSKHEIIIRKQENVLKEQQIKQDKYNTYVKVGAEIGMAVLSIGTYCALFKKGLKFEETGTYGSHTVRNLLSGFKLKK